MQSYNIKCHYLQMLEKSFYGSYENCRKKMITEIKAKTQISKLFLSNDKILKNISRSTGRSYFRNNEREKALFGWRINCNRSAQISKN